MKKHLLHQHPNISPMTVLRHAAALITAIVSGSCGSGSRTETSTGPTDTPRTPPAPPSVATVNVLPASVTLLALGASQQFTAMALAASGDTITGKTFAWSSSDSSVASVEASGLATAVSNGTATIRATVEGVGGAGRLEVAVAEVLTSITVTPDSALLTALGDTLQFAAEALDLNGNTLAAQPSFTWRSSDTAVATVDGTGLVVAVANGTVTISADVGNVIGTATLNIDQVVSSVTVTPDSALLTALGDTVRFAAEAHDANGILLATQPSVVWGSTDSAVASIDNTGLATAVANGPSSIIAIADAVEGNGTVEVSPVIQVVNGRNHTCVLLANGTAFCWGNNRFGQLGDGSTDERAEPVRVLGTVRFVFLATGGEATTCGFDSSGSLYCWGDNQWGQFGNGTTTNSLQPVVAGGGLSYTFVGLGAGHACGFATSGKLYCWGWNHVGQVGDSTANFCLGGCNPDLQHVVLGPTLVVGGITFSGVAVGWGHNCGWDAAGTAYCWGINQDGQRGDSSTVLARSVPEKVSGSHSYERLTTLNFTTCGTTTQGSTYCWGFNVWGQLGAGMDTSSVNSPVLVAGPAFSHLSSGNGYHVCAVEAGTSATFCWGLNQSGELGDGTQVNRNQPTQVNSTVSFVSIATSWSHSCGLDADGKTFCWGSRKLGVLGLGSPITGLEVTPRRVRIIP